LGPTPADPPGPSTRTQGASNDGRLQRGRRGAGIINSVPFTSNRALVQIILVSLAGCATGVDSSNSKDPGSGGTENGDASSSAGGSAGATGQAGSNGIINVAGAAGDSNGISDGSVALDPDAACAQESRDSQLIAVDLFLMVDRSVSMGCAAAETGCDDPRKYDVVVPPTRWAATGDAIAAFLNSPATVGIGAGVGFFALDGADTCNATAYATPAAPIAALPGSATSILDAIKRTHPGNTTPSVPALQGAISYATSYATSTPGHSAAVAFVTDGLPFGCDANNTVAGAAAIAQTAFMGSPSIRTYVL